jgi:molybdenum cofactor cytidylyltransferase
VTVVAVVLAAGAGSRFLGPTHKLLAPFRGHTVVEAAVAAAVTAGIGPVVVVTGAVELPIVSSADSGAILVHNPRWAEGQATSVQVGIEHARSLGADSVVVGLGDQPLVTPEAWRSVAAATTAIAVATYEGERGNPVKLDASVWAELPTSGDHGARHLIRLRPELVSEVACAGSSADIDTQEDLDRWI